MGSSFDEVSKEIKRMPYEVVKGDNNTPRVKIDDRTYTPQEISAMVLHGGGIPCHGKQLE